MRDFPHRRDAEKAALVLRGNINNDVSSPETVNDLQAHYQKYELTPARKAFASIENHLTLSKCYITPRWGTYKLGAVRTVQVEEWLDSLTLAPASKTKIKSVFSVLFSHAIRHEWVSLNPISKVRTSSKSLREKDVLTPAEFQALLVELSVREVAMVLLIGSTGVRRSELMALVWTDINVETMEVSITKSCVRNRLGDTKTECSRRPVPLHPLVLISARLEAPIALQKRWRFPVPVHQVEWNQTTQSGQPAQESHSTSSYPGRYQRKDHRMAQLSPHPRNAALGTWNGHQSRAGLLRHANSRTTLDIYTHARLTAEARRQHEGG